MNKLSINDLPVYTELTVEQLKKLEGASGLALAGAVDGFQDSGAAALAIQVGTPTFYASAGAYADYWGASAYANVS